MFRTISYTTVVVTLILTLFHNINAINLESTYETSCLDIKETVSVDLNWVMNEKIWYYPLMSRYDIYHMAADLTGKNPKDIREDEVYYDSCMTFSMAGGKYVAKGFGNKKLTYTVNPVQGLEVVEFSADDEGSNMQGKCYTTLTDNKTFMVGACCMSDGQMSWAVSSVSKQLPEKTKELIYDHAESLGFKREHFTAFRYDSCKDLESEDIVKNEL